MAVSAADLINLNVAINSMTQCIAFPSAITYAASKSALESVTRSLAMELGKQLLFSLGAGDLSCHWDNLV